MTVNIEDVLEQSDGNSSFYTMALIYAKEVLQVPLDIFDSELKQTVRETYITALKRPRRTLSQEMTFILGVEVGYLLMNLAEKYTT